MTESVKKMIRQSNSMYRMLRNQIQPWKSEGFLKFVRAKYPDKDPHHLLGSLGSMKISDSLIIPLSRQEHTMADVKREDYFLTYLPMAISLLQEYISSLEVNAHSSSNKGQAR
jgi:hypothetical protein